MIEFRPRQTRLPMDVVREFIERSPYVYVIIKRETVSHGVQDMEVGLVKVTNIDIDFANHFFYFNDIKTDTGIKLMMIPINLNGDE